jgi:hypothetical protein
MGTSTEIAKQQSIKHILNLYQRMSNHKPLQKEKEAQSK